MNLAAFIDSHAASTPDKVAIDTAKGSLSYSALDRLVRQYATRLSIAGVRRGDIVGVRMIDTADHVAALFAVARLGAIILPLDWRAARVENENIAERFKARVVLADHDNALPRGFPVVMSNVASELPDGSAPAELSDAPLVYALTSGTTGLKKAMVVTHEEMYLRQKMFAQEDIMRPDDRFLPAVPLAYAAGREFHFSLLIRGATVVRPPPIFTAAELVKDVAERKASVLLASPNITREVLHLQATSKERLLPTLRLFVSTTGKLMPEERVAVRTWLTPRLTDFYGSTGSGPIAVISEPADEPDATSAGHICSDLEVEIVDDEERSLKTGEVGWIRMRGPRITKRFAGDVESEHEGPRPDGWYWPGDLGSIDVHRILHLHGRSADLIKRGGLMVHAQEVERILMLHEAITEAAVVGIPSAGLGEEVGAFVVASRPVDARALLVHCRQHLAPYKVPVHIQFVEALPRNSSGKVQKALLIEMRIGMSS